MRDAREHLETTREIWLWLAPRVDQKCELYWAKSVDIMQNWTHVFTAACGWLIRDKTPQVLNSDDPWLNTWSKYWRTLGPRVHGTFNIVNHI